MTEAAWVQAFATVVLIGVTGWYAWKTKTIASSSKESAQAAMRSAEAAERSANAAERAIRDAERGRILERMPHLIGRQIGTTSDAMRIEVENQGIAPAYNVRVVLFYGSTEQLPSREWRLGHPLSPSSKDDEEIPFAIPREQWDLDRAYVIDIKYESGGLRFMAQHRQYQAPTDARPQSRYWVIDENDQIDEQLL